MRAVEFNWLTRVDNLEYDNNNNVLSFSLELDDSYVVGYVTPSKIKLVELMVDMNVQNNMDFPIRLVDCNDVCIVGEYNQVHAISGMPFKLTAYQFNDLNTYFEEYLLENKIWAI